MIYDFSSLKKKLTEIKEWLKKELSLLRTSRASPNLLDNIHINYYGQNTPIKHLSVITTEDARALRIKPWDTSLIPAIEQEIKYSDLGLQAVVDKDSVRVIFPELTQERRRALLKVVSEKLEEARISVRQIRDEYWRDIQNKERESEISEDDKYRLKDELQKIVDEITENFEEMGALKEKEIE